MNADVFLEDSFDSAHWLPNVAEDHKCRRLHGHTYRVRIDVEGKIGDDTGWVIDYAEIKSKWLSVKQELDHHCLNEILVNPTCELLSHHIANKLIDGGLPISRLELRETEHCGVTLYI